MPIDFPNSPSVGTTHTVDGITWEYDGAVWNLAGDRSFSASSSAPGSPKVGDTWFDTDNGKLYVYYDNFWVNPASIGLREDGITTAAASTITYTNSQGSASTLARSDHDHNIKAVGAFSAYFSATSPSLASSGATLVFDQEDYDVSSWYNTANGIYTPQKAGYYSFGCWFQGQSLTSTNFYHVLLRKNNSDHRQMLLMEQPGWPVYPRAGMNHVAYANGTTDYFTIFAYHTATSSRTLSGGSSHEGCRFFGYYLGS